MTHPAFQRRLLDTLLEVEEIARRLQRTWWVNPQDHQTVIDLVAAYDVPHVTVKCSPQVPPGQLIVAGERALYEMVPPHTAETNRPGEAAHDTLTHRPPVRPSPGHRR